MALQLILVRHALTLTAGLGDSDFDRALLHAGNAQCEWLGDFLLQNQISVNKVLSSPAQRAKTTAELLAKKLNINAESIEYNPVIYSSGAQQILDAVHQLGKDCKSLLLVGHNPIISLLANHFSENITTGLSPCDAVILRFNAEDWPHANSKTLTASEWVRNAVTY